MLDPHIRTALKEVSSTPSGTTYTASFKAPDRHGVFKFVVEYWRPGWVLVSSISPRPLSSLTTLLPDDSSVYDTDTVKMDVHPLSRQGIGSTPPSRPTPPLDIWRMAFLHFYDLHLGCLFAIL